MHGSRYPSSYPPIQLYISGGSGQGLDTAPLTPQLEMMNNSLRIATFLFCFTLMKEIYLYAHANTLHTSFIQMQMYKDFGPKLNEAIHNI